MLSEDLWRKVIKKHNNAESYKSIGSWFKPLNSTVVSLLKKWKVYSATAILWITGCPKITAIIKTKLFRQVKINSFITLEDMKKFVHHVEFTMHKPTISGILLKTALYVYVTRKRSLLKKHCLKSSPGKCVTKHQKDSICVGKS